MTEGGDRTHSVTATVAYRERIAMPPGAVLRVVIHDVSKMDTKSVVIGETTVHSPGNVPVTVVVAYDPASVDPSHTYAVRATIEVDGSLRWTSDTVMPVLTRGAGSHVDVMLVGVR